MFMNVKTKRTS